MERNMKKLTLLSATAVLTLGLAACGETKTERGLSGAAIGAGVGAGTAAVTGGNVAGGAAIGAAAGGAAGVFTDRDQLDLGDNPF